LVEDKTVILNAFAGLEKYLDSKKRKDNEVKIESDIKTVEDLIKKQGIPIEKVKMIMINGNSSTKDDIIKKRDVISLFPPIGGG